MFRKICFVVFVFFGLAFATKSNRIDVSYKVATQRSAKDSKPILLEFHAKWCKICLEMEKTVFRNPTVQKELRANFHFVRIDIEKDQEILCETENLPIYDCMELWQLNGVPAFVVVDKDGHIKHSTTGDFQVEDFLTFLKAVKTKLKKEE